MCWSTCPPLLRHIIGCHTREIHQCLEKPALRPVDESSSMGLASSDGPAPASDDGAAAAGAGGAAAAVGCALCAGGALATALAAAGAADAVRLLARCKMAAPLLTSAQHDIHMQCACITGLSSTTHVDRFSERQQNRAGRAGAPRLGAHRLCSAKEA